MAEPARTLREAGEGPAEHARHLVARLRRTFDQGRTRPASWRKGQLRQMQLRHNAAPQSLSQRNFVRISGNSRLQAAVGVASWLVPHRASAAAVLISSSLGTGSP